MNAPASDPPDIGLDPEIRCRCGGISHTSVGDHAITYTCIICGEWVATMTFRTAPGATLYGEDFD